MLSSVAGIRLLVLVGTNVPVPAPALVTRALRHVEVTTDDTRGDGFQLRFAVGRDAVVDSALVATGVLRPLTRVVVAALFGVLPEVLIDGVTTRHELTAGDEPGSSTLTVTGRDLSQLLDLEERNQDYPNQPDFVIAGVVLAPYARYGIAPSPAPTTDFPIQLERIPRQQETDLQFLRRLARRNGFVFYVEPLAPGASRAYLGPENRLSVPQPAISVAMQSRTNARALSISEDGLAPVGVQGKFVDPLLKRTWPLPSLPSPKVPPLALAPTPAFRTALTRDTAQKNPAQAALTGMAEQADAPDPVTVSGTLDGARYGRALRARQLVGLRGAGITHDGLYYVRSVTHTIRPGSYSQRFQLAREGTVPTVPAVIP